MGAKLQIKTQINVVYLLKKPKKKPQLFRITAFYLTDNLFTAC